MKILAGIVLFNPNIDRLKENIDAIYEQVSSIVLFNNGSNNLIEINNVISHYERIIFLNSKINKGIAFALKSIMDLAIKEEYDWVLTLDQDSVCMSGLINAYSAYFNFEKIGILTCNIVDRNFKTDSGFNEGEQYKEVKQCITSASLISVNAYKETDGFDEKMFIDSVDFDLCINMRLHGYKVIKINFDGLLHEVGHGRNVRLFFKKYVSYNHSPFRQYYMARNHKYLVYKYPDEFSKLKEALREIRAELIIFMFEKNKFAKIKERWRGIKDAKKMIADLKG